MPYAREKFSSWWIVLWTILFFGGMILIFSFLLGNPFFSGKITGKYIFSEESGEASLFIDEKFVEKGESEGNIELGKIQLCAHKYFFSSRCFDEEIRSNAFSVLDKKDITLFSRVFRVDTVTNKEVYFDPSEGGLFWLDFEKNLVWGIKREDVSFFSQRLERGSSVDTAEVIYDNGEKLFLVKLDSQKKTEKLEKLEKLEKPEKPENSVNKKIISSLSLEPVSVFFPENLITFSEVRKSFLVKNEKIEFLKSSFLQIKKSTEERLLLASFSEPIQKIYSYNQNKLLEFPTSVWIFTPENNSFEKLFSKQEKTRIFWHKKTSSVFFKDQDLLKRIYLK